MSPPFLPLLEVWTKVSLAPHACGFWRGKISPHPPKKSKSKRTKKKQQINVSFSFSQTCRNLKNLSLFDRFHNYNWCSRCWPMKTQTCPPRRQYKLLISSTNIFQQDNFDSWKNSKRLSLANNSPRNSSSSLSLQSPEREYIGNFKDFFWCPEKKREDTVALVWFLILFFYRLDLRLTNT